MMIGIISRKNGKMGQKPHSTRPPEIIEKISRKLDIRFRRRKNQDFLSRRRRRKNE